MSSRKPKKSSGNPRFNVNKSKRNNQPRPQPQQQQRVLAPSQQEQNNQQQRQQRQQRQQQQQAQQRQQRQQRNQRRQQQQQPQPAPQQQPQGGGGGESKKPNSDPNARQNISRRGKMNQDRLMRQSLAGNQPGSKRKKISKDEALHEKTRSTMRELQGDHSGTKNNIMEVDTDGSRKGKLTNNSFNESQRREAAKERIKRRQEDKQIKKEKVKRKKKGILGIPCSIM